MANIGQLKAVFSLRFDQIAGFQPDSDHDGLPDEWEIAHGLNPDNPSDGIQPFQNGTADCRLALWNPSQSLVSLPAQANDFFYPLHLADLNEGQLLIAAGNQGGIDSEVFVAESGTTKHLPTLSGKNIRLFAGDGTGMTSDGKLWRNGKLIPMRDLCQQWDELLDDGRNLEALKANKFGAFLIQAVGPEAEQAVKLAIKVSVKDNIHATGVDAVSRLSAPTDEGYQRDYWIMAPSGQVPPWFPGAIVDCENATLFQLPFESGTHLLIAGADVGIASANPAVIGGAEFPVTWHGNSLVTKNALIDWKIGSPPTTWQEVNLPVQVKVMKNRTVNVQAHRVRRINAGVREFPEVDWEQIEREVNRILAYQLNAWFDLKLEGMDRQYEYDTSVLEATDARGEIDPTGYYDLLDDARFDARADCDIRLLLLDEIDFQAFSMDPLESQFAVGHAPLVGAPNTCVVLVRRLGGNTRSTQELVYTIAHEIGHILVGAGHPDQFEPLNPSFGGVAPLQSLPDSEHKRRLMCSGGIRDVNVSKLVVKAEWDKAEEWFVNGPRGDN